LSAFKDVYLSDGSSSQDGSGGLLDPAQIANNIIGLVQRCGPSQQQQASLEKIIGDLFLHGKLEKAVLNMLWSRLIALLEIMDNAAVTLTSTTTKAKALQMRRGSAITAVAQSNVNSATSSAAVEVGHVIQVISMIAKAVPDVLASRLEVIAQSGFHAAVFHCKVFNTLRATCQCLQRFSSLKFTDNVSSTKRQVPTIIISAIQSIIAGDMCAEDESATRFFISVIIFGNAYSELLIFQIMVRNLRGSYVRFVLY